MTKSTAVDNALLAKLNKAVAEVNEAERAHEKTHTELVSKSKIVGALLLEARKRYTKVAEFEAFLKRVNGLKLSRAYDLMRLAGGRITDEQLRQESRERVRKHRAKKKLPMPQRRPEPVSVTDPDVTETPQATSRITQSPEISPEEWQKRMERLDGESESTPPPADQSAEAKASARALAEFTVACRTWLPKITVEADRQEARNLVATLTCSKCREAA